jgi:lipopolysaccharide transport system ATP-binding protein
MEYESRGAYIQSPAILTQDGVRVNNLVRGNTYRYTYTVQFVRSAINVRFAMLIKTPSGVELGGAESASAQEASLPYVTANACYQVEFHFHCALNPGVYFLNSGVLGDVDGSLAYLHRVMDIASFKVLPESGGMATGTIDFGCSAHIQPLPSHQWSEAANGQE